MRRVTHALCSRSIRFIQWPSGDEAISIMLDFETVSGFPKVIGVIDGTHIRINAPKENSADYINRKGYHSIRLQVNVTSSHNKVINVGIYLYIHLFTAGLRSQNFDQVLLRWTSWFYSRSKSFSTIGSDRLFKQRRKVS